VVKRRKIRRTVSMTRLLPLHNLPTAQPLVVDPQQNDDRVLRRGEEAVQRAGDLRSGGEVDVAVYTWVKERM
jgi:hypothetical protein